LRDGQNVTFLPLKDIQQDQGQPVCAKVLAFAPLETNCENDLQASHLGVDDLHMAPKTRLDPVVRLEEHREERSLQQLAAANRQLMAAKSALLDAQDQAHQDHRTPGPACLWDMADHAHAHARNVVEQAERQATAAQTLQGSSRTQYLSVHARAEAIRRVATSRREELVREGEKSSAREIEDMMLMRRRPVRVR
jgi:hypothetical protein